MDKIQIRAKSINSKRLVFLFGLLTVLAAVPITVFLIRRAPGGFEIRTGAGKEEATFELKTNKRSLKVGDTVRLDIYLDSGAPTIPIMETDVILNYNPSLLETTSQRIISGEIFDSYPVSLADSNKGRITISGAVVQLDKYFVGKGLFASVEFTAKKRGQADFVFVWGGEDELADTNVMGIVNGEMQERLRAKPEIETVVVK